MREGRETSSAEVKTCHTELMRVMVTDNIETDLDITSGARGEIVVIVLHLEKPPVDRDQAIVKLKKIPCYIFIKLSHTRATQLGVERRGRCALNLSRDQGLHKTRDSRTTQHQTLVVPCYSSLCLHGLLFSRSEHPQRHRH